MRGLLTGSITIPHDAPALAGRSAQVVEQRRRELEIRMHERQPANHPPSTTRFAPVMKVARSLARNTAALAMSWGRPNRGQGVRRRAYSSSGGSIARPGLPRHDLARRDAVADDEILRILDRDLLGQVDRSGLADTIRRIAPRRHDAVLRAQIDQASPHFVLRLLREHLSNRALAPVEHAGQVDRHDPLPLLGARIGEGRAGIRGRIVDQDIEPAEASDRVRDQGVDILPASDVGLLEDRSAPRRIDDVRRRIAALDRAAVDIRNDDARTFGREAHCDRAPDPGARSGDDGRFPGK